MIRIIGTAIVAVTTALVLNTCAEPARADGTIRVAVACETRAD